MLQVGESTIEFVRENFESTNTFGWRLTACIAHMTKKQFDMPRKSFLTAEMP